MQAKHGIAFVRSLQSMCETCCIIKKPTMIKAGAVAKAGIVRNNGVRNKATKNKMPVTTLVKPVRPPSVIPAEDSTKVVIVEVPKTAPIVVPTASANRTPLMPGSFPSLSSIFALDAQPMTVPKVSKISTKRNAKHTTTKFKKWFATKEKSSLKKVGAIEDGMDTKAVGMTE